MSVPFQECVAKVFVWTTTISVLLLGNWVLAPFTQASSGWQESSPDSMPKATAGVRKLEKEPRSWPGPDGKPLPFKNLDEVLDFLREANLLKLKRIGEGVTGAEKVLLDKGGIRMSAIFRDVKVYKPRMQFEDGTIRLHFRDDAIFECAAYQINLLLGLNIVPPAVPRKIGGRNGTIQAWLEGAMMEKERIEKNIEAPDTWRWRMQMQVMHLFDSLIYNEDRNLGNMLITDDWLIVLIDHTRAFRNHSEPFELEKVRYCDKNLLANLKNLDINTLEERVKDFLTTKQIRSVMKRRDLIVEHIETLIAEHGENGVLFNFFR